MNDHDWATIRQRIRDGRSAITPDGELPYANREAILAAIIEGEPDRVVAERRWAEIELECARHVWPIWRTAFPDDKLPLELAERSYRTRVAHGDENVGRELARLQTHLDNLYVDDVGEAPLAAGHACLAAAYATTEDRDRAAARSELDLDPDEWDACFYGAIAAAGGAVWDGLGDRTKRWAYWEWYLDMIEAKISR